MIANRLKELIELEPATRKACNYEKVIDEFVAEIGGERVTSLVSDATKSRNADYFLKIEEIEAVIELKQIHEQTVTIPNVARKLIERGKISIGLIEVGTGRFAVAPGEMTPRDRYRLYAMWGRAFDEKLKDANRQIRAINHRIPASERKRMNGVIFLNTGNYQFTTERMSNILGVFLTKQWKAGHYREIDFAIALAIDMFTKVRNPLNGAAIGKPSKKEFCHPLLNNLLRNWTEYLACGLGRSLSYDVDYAAPAVVDDVPYEGKIRRISSN